jgi:RND family efflux transporter MFP subunit
VRTFVQRSRALVSAIFLTVLLGLSGCGQGGGGGEGPPPAAVTAATPLVERVADWDEFTGRFRTPTNVEVRARVSGYLEAVLFEDGAAVEEGQLLFTIDPRPFQAELDAANGALAQAQAQFEQARSEYERAQRLSSNQVISEETLEQRRAAMRTAEAAVATARGNAEAAELNLEFTQVVAPIAGRASARQQDPGNLISGGNSGGDVLTTIVSDNPLWFEFDVSEAIYLRYQRTMGAGQGAPVELRLQDETAYTHQGLVTFADNAIDPASGTIRMRAEVPNPDGLIRPGMLGTARVRGSAPYEALLVPQSAILSDGARRLVYVVGENNTVEARTVTLGPVSGNLQVVSAGLGGDDRVILDNLLRVRPGAPVDPQAGTVMRDEAQVTPLEPQPQPASVAHPVE